MLILVSYDVSTLTLDGKRRLRHVAKACQNLGIRVQNSVFECYVNWSQWLELKEKLEKIINPETDSLRYYNLGNSYEGKITHVGTKATIDPMKDTLII